MPLAFAGCGTTFARAARVKRATRNISIGDDSRRRLASAPDLTHLPNRGEKKSTHNGKLANQPRSRVSSGRRDLGIPLKRAASGTKACVGRARAALGATYCARAQVASGRATRQTRKPQLGAPQHRKRKWPARPPIALTAQLGGPQRLLNRCDLHAHQSTWKDNKINHLQRAELTFIGRSRVLFIWLAQSAASRGVIFIT